MYNVSSLSLQNIYARSAAEKYSQTGNTTLTAENFYAILAERVNTSAEKPAEYDFATRVSNDTQTKRIIEKFVAAGIFKAKEEEEEEDEEEKKIVDILLKAIKARQGQKKEEDETIDRNKSELTDEEVEEVLSGLRCTNSFAVE